MAGVLDGFELRAFDDESLKQTRAAWDTQLAKYPKDLLPSDFHRILDWADAHRDYTDGEDGLAYGVFGPHNKGAEAVIEVVYTRSGNKWLKMLNLFLSPSLFAGFIDAATIDTEKLTKVYSAAIVGTVKLTDVHPSNTVKLYGRSGTLLAFLRGIAAYLQEHSSVAGVKVTIDGRWLVFKAKHRR